MARLDIGVIGLGNMGGNVARNLLDQGYTVTCYDVDTDKREALANEGATPVTSPLELTDRSDVLVTSLPDTEALQTVYLGEEGVLRTETEDLVSFEMSTVPPDPVIDIARRAAERNLHVLGAPVMGGPEDSRNGTLTLMIGGESEILEVEPISEFLEVLSSEVHYTGGVGSSHTLKLVNNYVDLASAVVMMEGTSLAAARGLDGELVRDVLIGPGDDTDIQRIRLDRVLERNFDQGFTIDYATKDLKYFLELAESAMFPAPLASLVFQRYVQARAAGLGDKDPSAVIEMYERDTDARFEAGNGRPRPLD
jgi:3-hydroxyisobutyrate dehydrogenase-like beta-hydroxyacid dehydrogenase